MGPGGRGVESAGKADSHWETRASPSLSSSVAGCQALTEQAAGDSSEGQMQSWLQGWVILLPEEGER